MPALPWIVWAGLGLIGWRVADKVSDDVSELVPWVLGGVALVVIVKGAR